MQPLQYVMPPGVLTGSLSWSLHMEQVSASDTSTRRVVPLEPPAGAAGAAAMAGVAAAAAAAPLSTIAFKAGSRDSASLGRLL